MRADAGGLEALALASVKSKEAVASRKKYVKSEGASAAWAGGAGTF